MDALLNAQPNLAEGQSFERDFPKGLERTEGYVPTNNPVSVSVPNVPIMQPLPSAATRRWDVYANATGVYMRCGRVRIAGDEGNVIGATISGATSSLASPASVSDGDCVWLECTSKALAGLTLEFGSYPAEAYEESGGNITRYSHAIGDFFDSDPGAGSTSFIDNSNTTHYYRARVPDCDLIAKEVTVFVAGNATHGVIIEP